QLLDDVAAAHFVGQYYHNATALLADALQRLVQRPARAQRVFHAEQVADGVSDEYAREHRFVGADLALHQGKVGMRTVLVKIAVADDVEVAPRGRQPVLTGPLDGSLVGHAVVDQVHDGADLQAMLAGKGFEIGTTRHGPVGIHHFADHG